MNTDLSGKVVMVTGASGGIGSAIVRAMAGEGARVVLHARTGGDRATRLAKDIAPAESVVVVGDLRREADVRRVFKAALKKFGRIDVLVANAGSWEMRDVALKDMTLRQWRATQDSVLTSAFLSLREFLGCAARQGRGNAVLIGSTAAIHGEAGHADYAAAKSAMAFGLTRTLKNEMAESVVVVGDLRREATMALPKLGMPEDVANSVVFLASDRLAGHVTGQVMEVAGGMEGRWLWRPEEVDPELALPCAPGPR